MEYNTTRNDLIIREYGRNIQKMIEHLLTIEDREKRQKNAMIVIELMGTLSPHLRNVEDFRHKLWDHLFLISDFKLDVDSPYPIPTRETLRTKPEQLPYPKKHPRHKHFGKNLELVIDKAMKETDKEKKEGFAQCVGNYMKLAYANWHRESIHDDMIKTELAALTNDELIYQGGGNNPAIAALVQESYRNGNNNNGNKRKPFQHKNNNNTKNNNGKPPHKYNKYNKNRSK